MRLPILSAATLLLAGATVTGHLLQPFPFDLFDLLEGGENITEGHPEWTPDDLTLESKPNGPKLPGDNPLYLCSEGQEDDLVAVDNIDLVPNPPQRGKDLRFNASGQLFAVIDKGTAMRVQVKLAGTRLINKDYDLCAELKRFGQSCPFNSNYISVSKEMHLDKRIPKGKYWVHVRVRTPENQQVSCFQGTIRL